MSRPAPPDVEPRGDMALPVAAGASLGVHIAVLVWMAVHGVFGEERAAGAGEDRVLIEGIPVMLIEAAPVPEAPPVEATEAPAEAAPPPEPVETPPEPVAEATETPPDPLPPEPTPPEPQAEPPPNPASEPAPEPAPATAPAVLPPPDAETGELPARPEDAVVAPEAESAEAAPAEDEPRPPDPEAVPTPRPKPERTEIATAETPPKQPEQEPPPAQPAAPPPSAPSAASTAARSGGAGGGGASQAAGNAAASAYRAKVAAQLKRSRFYPNAARRDRLTGSATVSFTLNAAGKVTATRVVRSSGKRILDEAAIEMVKRASPFPPIPSGLGKSITIQAPIAFDLPR